jgi:transketolase
LRKEFSNTIEKLALKDDKIVFLTGDLGFNALENLQKALGDRFINVGIAEQSMVSIAAGIAHKGYKVICYSIAPFMVFRPLEQIRNDICFHKKHVILVGNGGGYGYGIMGSTHHAISDIAALSSLPNMNCWIPAFSDDVETMMTGLLADSSPAYFRLGNSKPSPQPQQRKGQFNQVLKSTKAEITMVALGPIVMNVLEALAKNNLLDQADLFTAVHLPLQEIPTATIDSINKTKKLLIAEEHVETGGLAQSIVLKLSEMQIPIGKFKALNAKNYPSGLYGDQQFHQAESGLDSENIAREILNLLA